MVLHTLSLCSRSRPSNAPFPAKTPCDDFLIFSFHMLAFSLHISFHANQPFSHKIITSPLDSQSTTKLSIYTHIHNSPPSPQYTLSVLGIVPHPHGRGPFPLRVPSVFIDSLRFCFFLNFTITYYRPDVQDMPRHPVHIYIVC